MECLDKDQMLNDAIIDFYLGYSFQYNCGTISLDQPMFGSLFLSHLASKMPAEQRKRYHFCSSFLYKRFITAEKGR